MHDNWKINVSNQADKFLSVQRIRDSLIKGYIDLALLKFKGEDTNIKIKKLSGKWEGFYRIRAGKIRIICSFDFDSKIVSIEVIDFRGNVYK